MSDAPILTPFLDDADVILYAGDCVDVMRRMPEASVDAIVTDPPYELGFMGKAWDGTGIAYQVDTWAAALRVLKPGGHLLAFSGTRTYHRMTCAIEDAGFEIRDCIAWMYGSGFPKSLDVSKAIDKAHPRLGMFDAFAEHLKERRVAAGLTQKDIAKHFPSRTGGMTGCVWNWENAMNVPTSQQWQILQEMLGLSDEWTNLIKRVEAEREVVGKYETDMGGLGGERLGSAGGNITVPATPAAQKWNGWGTALKPAFEPVVVARKPIIGTVAQNVLEHGTGALNIDACRIEGVMDGSWGGTQHTPIGYGATRATGYQTQQHAAGRWPANVALDETAASMLDQQSGTLHARGNVKPETRRPSAGTWPTWNANVTAAGNPSDSGGASRFFYTAKASRQDRNVGGLANNTHPTVKPTDLMRWLIRLVTPPGGIILDPFGGSGSTGLAARAENVRCILIEREPEYLEIIRDRLSQLSLLSELLDDE